jgi:Mn2+/Fe2+ NRAMP family transporter
MLRLAGDRRLMGGLANGPVLNVLAWVVVAALIGLTLALIASGLLPR